MKHHRSSTIWVCLAASLTLFACSPSAEAPDASLPDVGFVDVPGGRVAFRIMGRSTGGVPLIVIHGGPGGSSCAYPSTLTGIAAERPVVMYDQLGSGYSDRIRSTDLETLAVLPRFVEEVSAIRDELGLDEVHILGHSWGGTVALEYLLAAAPTGVLSVTLVGPLIGTDRWLEDANDLVAQLSEESQAAVADATDDLERPEAQRLAQLAAGPPDATRGYLQTWTSRLRPVASWGQRRQRAWPRHPGRFGPDAPEPATHRRAC